MKQVQFKVTLTLQAPILTHTSGAVGFGLDAAMQKDSQGRPIFTGSLIRGNLRHAWDDLREITAQPTEDKIAFWLGKESDTAEQDPERARLSFSEYWTDENWDSTKQTGKRYRIAIDEKTGAVKTGALQVLDSPYAVGEVPRFSGIISARLDTEAEVDELKQWLEYAFTLIPAIGALKTNGFGRLIKADVKLISTNNTKTIAKLDHALLSEATIGLRIKPHRSFCFAKAAIGADNHFESKQHIPAGALVAAIANHIAEDKDDYKTLNSYLSDLHFSHARAVLEGANKRPIALPLTMVVANNQFYDIAANQKAELIHNEAPTFLIDWKDKQFKAAKIKLNHSDASPMTQLNIRTAINRKTGTAKESQLFSMETVSPEGFDWISNVSLEKIPPEFRAEVIQQLYRLFQQPLSQLGKTKASASVTLEKCHCYTKKEQNINTKQVIIYLQSAARLLPTGYQNTGTNQGDDLTKAYKKAWNELSNDSLILSHFFAQQQLYGGEHWWKRNRKEKGNYHPELFTQAGSVFILNINPEKKEKAQEHLKKWQQQGLPQIEGANKNWKENPWIAANGYGEIALNLNIMESTKND